MRRYFGFVAFAISLTGFVWSRVVDVVTPGTGNFTQDPIGEILLTVAFLAFPAVGSVIVFRQPHNAMGWIFAAIGALTGIGITAQTYTEHILPDVTSPGPVDYVAAWISNWWWPPLLGLVMIFTTFLFPTGRALSPRWRIPFLIGAASIAVVTLVAMTEPRLVAMDHKDGILYTLDNPIGIEGLGDPEQGPIGTVLLGVALVCLVIGVVSLIVRFKRSRGVERQQLKWFAFGAALIPVNILLSETFGLFGDSNAPFAIAVGALPVAAGIAILRYRLYDIDVVINRALVYGSLSAILAGGYVGLVFAFQAILAPVTAESDLAVAASTLAVAALFRPVRSRVQSFIDRRFYRRKFDAEKTIEGFNLHLRDEVDLRELSARLVTVVSDTMQPAHVSLWLRSET